MIPKTDNDPDDTIAGTDTVENGRLEALRRYDILDTRPEEAFDRLTDLAADFFQVDVAFIAFLDADRQWFKSSVGLNQSESTLAASFCTHTVELEEILVIEHAAEDNRVADSPFVTEAGFRFYAGAPLQTSDGYTIGTFSVMDREPGSLSENDRHRLRTFADMAMDELENRRETRQHEQLAQRFEAILNDPNILAGVLSPDGILLEVNDTSLQYIDETRDQVLGNPFWETPWWPPRLQSDVQTWVERAANGEYVEYSADLTTPDGAPFSVEGTLRPVSDESGTITALIVSARDVTARKQREESLRETTARLEALFEASPDMINVHDIDGNIITPNSRLLDKTGYSAEELSNMNVWDLDEAIERDTIQDAWAEMSVGAHQRHEGQYRRRDGSTFPVEVHVRRLDLKGEDRFLAISRDITNQKEREQALRRQRNLLEQTQRLAGAWEIDLRSEEVSWSDKVYDIHEVDPDTEIQIEDGIEFYAPEAHPTIRQAFDRCAENGEPYDLELPLITAKGNRRWVRTVGAPVEWEDGQVVKVAGAFQNITERKRRERELRDRERKTEALYTATEQLLTATRPEDVAAQIESVIRKTFEYPINGVHFAQNGELVPVQVSPTVQERWPDLPNRDLDGDSLGAQAYRSKETITASEIPPSDQSVNYSDLGAGACIPLGTHGVISIASTDGDGIDEFDVQLLEILAADAAAVLDRISRERELERQNDLFAKAQHLASIGGWEYDVRTDESLVTDQVLRIHGLAPSDTLSTEKSIQFYHPDDRPVIRTAFSRAVEEGEPYDLELRFLTAEGEQRWIRTRGTPQVEDGEVVRVRGSIQDITDRKERERQLERYREYTDRLLDASDDLLFVCDNSGNLQRWNRRVASVTGYSEDELDGKSIYDFVPAADYDRTQETIDEVFEKGRSQLEIRLVTKNGERIPYEFAANCVEHPDGDLRLVGIGRDITQRQEREERLHGRHQKIESLYEATKRLLTADDVEAVSDRIHEVLQDVFDYELNNTGFVDGEVIVPEKTTMNESLVVPRPTPQPLDGESLSAQTVREGKTVVIDNLDGLDNEVEYGRLQAAAAVPIGSRGVIVVGKTRSGSFEPFDLRLIEVLGTYASMVLDRLHREGTLRQAKKEAEEASRLKSAMLANMSHEIRTPLTSVTGFAEVLKDDLDGKSQEFARRIYQSGQRLMKTLDSVLQLSRLEASTYKLQREEVSLTEIVRECMEMILPAAEEKSIEIDVDIPDAAAHGMWNKGALRQIIDNLLENAIKFTPKGGTVEIRVFEENDEAILEIEDTGIGIRQGLQSEIFEAFKQESEGLTREYEGSGLGLSIVQRLTEAHQGSVAVESEKGNGSRFTVRLPQTRREESDARIGPSAASEQHVYADSERTEASIFRRMYRITADQAASFEEKTSRLLGLGREYLGLPYGFLTRISDGTQEILHASGGHPLLETGATCPLSEAYCRKTLQQESLLAVQDAPATGWKEDPAYERFQLGAYIGSKVWMGEELYGTFCFAASEPRSQPFTPEEKTFVELLTRWVSYELEQQEDKKRLRSQNEQLEQFASVVSHDLRNPLNVAQGRLALALETLADGALLEGDANQDSDQVSDPDELLQNHLVAVDRALNRMEVLISDVLALTWSEQEFKTDELSVLHLTDLASTSWDQVSTENATLNFENDRTLYAHEGRLRQLLENLFRNAIEHGGETVTVWVGSTSTGFFVEDDGPGIPEENREKIFERGYSSRDDGTGLGLPIVRTIANAHEWSLSVTEGREGGARFEIDGVISPET